MADTLTLRSPLQSWEARFTALPASATISEEPFIAMVDLWVDPSGPGGNAAADLLGVAALPTTPSTAVAGSNTMLIWFGPQEWLVTSRDRTGEALEAQLREAITEHGGAAVDVSAQRTTVRLRGAHARDVLAAVVLIPLSDNGTDYRILVRASFAGYLAAWLLDAAEEFGGHW